LAIVVPLSLENRGTRYEVPMPRVPWLRNQGIANVQGIAGIGFHELTNFKGRFEQTVVAQFQVALLWALDLRNSPS
jgi:mRNA interferase MazF